MGETEKFMVDVVRENTICLFSKDRIMVRRVCASAVCAAVSMIVDTTCATEGKLWLILDMLIGGERVYLAESSWAGASKEDRVRAA